MYYKNMNLQEQVSNVRDNPLGTLLGKLKKRFNSAYVEDSLKTITKTENIILEFHGIELSKSVQWAGNDILKLCAYALEDSNFHTESAKVLELIRD